MSKLTDRRIRNLKAPGRHPDGETLYLVVSPSGYKSWIQRLVIRGRRHDLGLGPFPLVSLAEARRRAQDNRALARSGGDPMSEKQAAAGVPSFKALARQHFAENSTSWRNLKHRTQWLTTLETYAFPSLGGLRVSEITRRHVISTLTPIWTSKPETAKRVRQRIRSVMDRAVAMEYVDFNPAGDAINAALPRQPRAVAHHRALPYGELPAALRASRDSEAFQSAKLAFEMLALTAGRSGEVRGMTWDEVDLHEATWTIPGSRMKAGKPHRVPLSPRAMAILGEARRLDNESGLIFPGPRSGGALCDVTFILLIRRLGLDFVPHGLRSSFRDWAAEKTSARHDVVEAALAHTVGNATEAAYFRSDLLDLRRPLMDEWSAYLGGGIN